MSPPARTQPIPPNPTPGNVLAARLEAEAHAVGVTLADPQIERLTRYLGLIAEWTRRARLTAVADPLTSARVHVADSLLCLRAEISQGATMIDVGSGAGLPGIPVAIARPDLRITLLEAETRKAAFLEMAVGELSLPVVVLIARAEDAAHDPVVREGFDVVTARAVAPLQTLFELSLPFARVGGKGVFLKGPAAEREVARAARARAVVGGGEAEVMAEALLGGERRRVVVVPKVRPTPHEYPRRAGVPSRDPL